VKRGGPNADPALVWGWLAGRSLARGLPQPVPDRGGMRVDTGSPDEVRRHVFAGPEPGLAELAASIHAGRIFLKMCGPAEQLRALAPPRWQLQPGAYLMTHAGPADAAPVPADGYRLELERGKGVFAARIHARDGSVAASGHAAEHGGYFVFDRIATHAAHRRRGLGRTIMSALGAMQQARQARRVLVATEEGRALYEALGWKVVTAYSTVVIPGGED
jgi:GNAT superfamily N-acetyltransferase